MEIERGLSSRLSILGGRMLDLALPAVCAGCEREGPALCAECAVALDTRLASPPGVPIGLPGDIPAPLVQVEWCTSFTGVTRRALHRLKYAGDRRLAEPLGLAVARRWARAGVSGDCLVPVPASPDRVRERGYDQAALIARAAGTALRLPVRADLLERSRITAAQFDLDRAARAGNVAGAFRLRFGAVLPPGRAPGWGTGEGRGDARRWAPRGLSDGASDGVSDGVSDGAPWLVLVDDVLTTGSTLAACATVLLEAGALAVSAITVARER